MAYHKFGLFFWRIPDEEGYARDLLPLFPGDLYILQQETERMDRITRTVPDKLLMSIRAIFVKSKKTGNRIWKTIKNVKNVMSKRNTVLKNIVNNPRKDGCVSFNIQQTEIRDEK